MESGALLPGCSRVEVDVVFPGPEVEIGRRTRTFVMLSTGRLLAVAIWRTASGLGTMYMQQVLVLSGVTYERAQVTAWW